jgi:hypothetical protein
MFTYIMFSVELQLWTGKSRKIEAMKKTQMYIVRSNQSIIFSLDSHLLLTIPLLSDSNLFKYLFIFLVCVVPCTMNIKDRVLKHNYAETFRQQGIPQYFCMG